MYYRVAIQVDAAPTWQWKSTVLSSGAARGGEQRTGVQFGDSCTISPRENDPSTGSTEHIRT
jgi:hypothetical protein